MILTHINIDKHHKLYPILKMIDSLNSNHAILSYNIAKYCVEEDGCILPNIDIYLEVSMNKEPAEEIKQLIADLDYKNLSKKTDRIRLLFECEGPDFPNSLPILLKED